jgi:hypothetical protein
MTCNGPWQLTSNLFYEGGKNEIVAGQSPRAGNAAFETLLARIQLQPAPFEGNTSILSSMPEPSDPSKALSSPISCV